MRKLSSIVLAMFLLWASTLTGFAAETLSAPQALERAQAGELVLIDIRRPSEWKETGIASVAVPLSMHEDGFLEGLEKIKQSHKGKQIALICASGGRSAYLQKELLKRDLGSTIDVSEGMFGNGDAPGWLKRGLPTKQVD